MTARFIVIFLIIIIALSVTAYLWGYKAIKEKVLYRLVHRGLESHFEKTYSANILIESVAGSILRDLILKNIQLKGLKGLPEDLGIKIKNIKLNYTLKNLIKGTPKIELDGLELAYKKIKVPVTFSQQGNLIILTFNKVLVLNQLQDSLFKDDNIVLNGVCEFKGRVVLENYEPKYCEIKLESDDVEIFYTNKIMAKADISLNLDNKMGVNPCMTGSVLIKDGEYLGDVNKIESKDMPLLGIINGLFMDIGIKGSNFRVKNDNLNLLLKGNILLRKEPRGRPFLLGKIDSLEGAYIAYQHKFNLKKAEIIFNGKSEEEAKIDVIGEARVKQYRIIASLKGTPSNSRLDISSRPELARNEIIALLLFGKRMGDLSVSEEEALLKAGDLTGSFVSKFFLGRAEARIAEIIGVDDFSIQASINMAAPEGRMPSAEIGKYLDDGKLYGTYKITPGSVNTDQDLTRPLSQTVGGQYGVTDNIYIKGERNFNESIKAPQEDKISVEYKRKF